MIQEYTVFQGDKVPRSWEKGGHPWGRQFLPQLGAHYFQGTQGDTLYIFLPVIPTRDRLALKALQGFQFSNRQEKSFPIA